GLEARGRTGTKASANRIIQIASKTRRRQNLDAVKKFIYSPTGDNRGRDSLSHSEVMKAVAYFIQTKPVMQHILANGYPIILIDESQDTNKHLIDALFALQAAHATQFSLGLLGDMMQRIYSDGKEGLGNQLPADWATPVKQLNHRCPKRIVRLINKIRDSTDRQNQEPRSDSIEGHARIFILPADTGDKQMAERTVVQQMAAVTGETEWEAPDGCKRLILEHRMAARRMGFLDMFIPLHDIDDFKTGLLDGTLPITRFFAGYILPLLQRRHDQFAIAKIVRGASPLLADDKLRSADKPEELLRQTRDAVASLLGLWSQKGAPTFGAVLRNIASTGLFVIPDALRPSAFRDEAVVTELDDPEADDADRLTAKAAAIEAFLGTPFAQIEPYSLYVAGTASFDTHQGVKGLEFPRVMVIMDDTEARGFLFKYEKLFGGGAGDDATSASTRRLFYVTCSRAERGLALVAYSTEPERVRQHVLREGWFTENEIQIGLGAAK
ncbi:MAG: UvrD-helicase domain-containing protein, partial [Alphaproteobacteria bacterium]